MKKKLYWTAHLKKIEEKFKAGKRITKDELKFLIKHANQYRKFLNKVTSNHYCTLDNVDGKSPYDDKECPTCMANGELVKKVKL